MDYRYAALQYKNFLEKLLTNVLHNALLMHDYRALVLHLYRRAQILTKLLILLYQHAALTIQFLFQRVHDASWLTMHARVIHIAANNRCDF